MTKFRSYQIEEFADNHFQFDENGGKFFQQVEKTVGKGEIARYDVLQTRKDRSLFGKGLNQIPKHL